MRIAMIGQKGLGVGKRGGGIERHVTELARRMGKLGHDVIVYSRDRSDEFFDYPGVRVRYLPSIRRKNFETITHTLLCTLDVLRSEYDIIHYHGVGPSTLCWITRLFKPKARTVVTFHSRDRFHKKWGRLARLYLTLGEWTAVWFPHATIAVSHAIAVYAHDILKRDTVYLPNGASVKYVTQTNELSRFNLEPKQYLLSVSRLVPHKGQHYLIEAYQILQREDPTLIKNLQLVIVGAESYGQTYQVQLSRLAAGNRNIRFLGFQHGAVLEQLFAHAKLFVHASEFEGLPVAVLEAMSFGLPVLVSDIPANLEVIHNAGFKFTAGSVPDLQKTMASLLHHSELLDLAGAQSREIIKEHFNWDRIVESTISFYLSIRH